MSGDVSCSSAASSDIYALGGILQLLFPSRYRLIAKKCHRQSPSARYSDVASMRRAISRRDTFPKILLALLILAAVSLGSLTPYFLKDKAEKAEKARVDAAREDIYRKMMILYKETTDSITDKRITPYREIAYCIGFHYTNKYTRLRETVQEEQLRHSIDTMYENSIVRLDKLYMEMPSFEEMYENGLLSREEYRYYSDYRDRCFYGE